MNPSPRSRRRRRRSSSRRCIPTRDSSTEGAPPSPPPRQSDTTSARSLAAALWKMHLASDFHFQLHSHQNQNAAINEQSGCQENDIFFKLEACAKLPNTDMEKVTKWDHFYPKFPNKPSTFYKSTKGPIKSPSLETRRDKKEIYHKIDSMKQTLILERENRVKIEKVNSKLLSELKEARSSAKKYFKGYEKERKAREEIEEVCEDLVREIEHEKADIELFKNESLKMREEVEEERRMLQMAEVWREERVQMKLVDAKITLENKYSQLNHLEAEIEAFLKTHNADMASVKRAETLIKKTNDSTQNWVRGESSKPLVGPIKGNLNAPVSCDSSQGSVHSIIGVFKENNDLSEVCSSATRNSRNKGTTIVNKFWGKNGNSRKAGADVQNKKRRSNGLKGKIVGTRKEVCNVGVLNGENNNFVF
ncbi:uncharacterized protein LOC144545350 [Carex rostrata]